MEAVQVAPVATLSATASTNLAKVREVEALYGLVSNPALTEILDSTRFPTSEKMVGVLILAYKKAVPNDAFRAVSTQAAGLIRDLREQGFTFRVHPTNPDLFWFPQNGEKYRECMGLDATQPLPTPTKKEGRYEEDFNVTLDVGVLVLHETHGEGKVTFMRDGFPKISVEFPHGTEKVERDSLLPFRRRRVA